MVIRVQCGIDPSSDSRYLLTSGADMSVKLWSITSGELLHDIPMPGPVRNVEWAEGDAAFLVYCDPFRGSPSQLKIFDVDKGDMKKEPVERSVWTDLGVPEGKKVNKATWMPLNKAIVVGDDGKVRVFDVNTGKVVVEFAAQEEDKLVPMEQGEDATHHRISRLHFQSAYDVRT